MITSGKGGVGKTTISVNVGIALAQAGVRTILFDADLQLANIDVMLRLQPEFSLQHVVARQKTLTEILCPGPEGLLVIGGGSAIPSLMAAGPKRMSLFAEQIDELSSVADCLIFDTGAGLDNRVMAFCQMADEIIIVTTPDPASVTDAYATIKVASKKIDPKPIRVVVNMASGPEEANYIFSTLAGITKRFLDIDIAYLGFVTANPEIVLCNRKRTSFILSAPNLECTDQIREVALEMHPPSKQTRRVA